MAPDGRLGRKRFWAGAMCALLGAGALYFGRDFQLGRLRAPGPGAFPLALAAAILLFGAAGFLRGLAGLARPERTDPPCAVRQSLIITQGDPVALSGHTIAVVLLAAALGVLAVAALLRFWQRRRVRTGALRARVA